MARGRPAGSKFVHRWPRGLLTSQYTRRSAPIGLPSTQTSWSGPTRVPSSRTTSPPIVTRPARTRSSQWRREPRPAWARYLLMRSMERRHPLSETPLAHTGDTRALNGSGSERLLSAERRSQLLHFVLYLAQALAQLVDLVLQSLQLGGPIVCRSASSRRRRLLDGHVGSQRFKRTRRLKAMGQLRAAPALRTEEHHQL